MASTSENPPSDRESKQISPEKMSELELELTDFYDYVEFDPDGNPISPEEHPELKISMKKVAFLKEFPFLSESGKVTVPVMYMNEGGRKKLGFIDYDQYFQLMNRYIWNHPEYSKDAKKVTMEERMKDAAPYNVFFTTLKHCPETNDQLYSVAFTDLLCPSLGKLKCSFHITFMAKIDWIISQFAKRGLHNLPMTLIHGFEGYAWPEKKTMKRLFPQLNYHHIEKEENALGCHHTKLSIFVYDDDSMRLVIGSANLCADDWGMFSQQLWFSPRCPKLPEGSSILDGESPTGFKLSLLDYLFAYKNRGDFVGATWKKKINIPSLDSWIERIQNTNFSEIRVALLYTIPGVHYPRKNGSFLHFMGHLLSRDCVIPAPKEEHNSWPVVVQTSALGLVGKKPDDWLTTHFLKALASNKADPYLATLRSVSKVKFNLIFPTVQNSFDGYMGVRSACCCPYDKGVKDTQPWLIKHKCQWKAEKTKRTRAIAHSKCCCRISPDCEKMAYYFLTSANLSRSAWGKIPNNDSGIFIRSYEMGVLFLPKYFGEEYFEIKDNLPNLKNKRLFPIIFDLPLTPYGPEDDSYCVEELVLKDLHHYEKSDLDILDVIWTVFENPNLAVEEVETSEKLDDGNNNSVPDKLDSKSVHTNNVVESETPVVLSEQKDMKYAGKPSVNVFFPTFMKK